MTPPRFQFTIRGLLWLTFWAAVSATAWGIFIREPVWPESEGVRMVCIAIGTASAFLGIGTLFGRSFGWLGCVVATAYLVALVWAIRNAGQL